MAAISSARRVAISRPCRFQCLADTTPSSSSLRPFTTPSFHPRSYSNGAYHAQDGEIDRDALPRWKQSPRGMSMPFRVRQRNTTAEWKCNDDPVRLGDFYSGFLGQGGDTLLSEETRWLAVTHKSFDQGRRGFNDRLSYLGRRIVELQTSLGLASLPQDPLAVQGPDEFGRYPFEHTLLEGLGNLSEKQKAAVLSRTRLSQLGKQYGLDAVLRWKPKNLDNLAGSGAELVLAQAMYAIIGAVALERGGQVANRITKERILTPLGIIIGEQL